MQLQALDLKLPPPVIAFVCGGLMWGVAEAVPLLAIVAMPDNIAMVFAGVGVMIALVAVISFMLSRTTINPHRPDQTSHLVTSGLYRFSRNPMYLAVFLMLVSWGFWLQNIAAILLLPLFPLYITEFQIKPEEKHLEQLFGKRYREYCSRVRRWF